MGKHTPGPWLNGRQMSNGANAIIGDGDSVVAILPGAWNLCTHIEADASLIAAAPELLDALEWMVAHDDTNEGNEPVESLGGQTWSEYNAYWLAGLEQARAAIAKAKGESDGR